MKYILASAMVLLTFGGSHFAQTATPTPEVHDHGAMKHDEKRPVATPTPHDMGGMDHGGHKQAGSLRSGMSSTVNLGDPMAREASGTAWAPDSSREKSGHELVLHHDDEHKIFRVNALSLGYVRDLVQGKGLDVGLGGMLTFNTNPTSLAAYFGGTTHGGWQIFLRFRPSRMR